MAISPTGRWLVSGHDSGDVWLWNLESLDSIGRPHRLPGPLCHHNDTVRAVAISAPIEIETETGTPVSTYCWLVSGSDKDDCTARLWKLTEQGPSDHPFFLSAHKGAIGVVAFSPDNKWLVIGSADYTASLWDLANLAKQDPAEQPNPEPVFVFSGHTNWISALAISTDSRWLVTASGDSTARRWDLWDLKKPPSATTKPLVAAPLIFHGHQGQIRAVAISSDDHWLVTGDDDGTARRWDLAGFEDTYPIVLCGHRQDRGTIRTVAISPQSHWLVTGSEDGTA